MPIIFVHYSPTLRTASHAVALRAIEAKRWDRSLPGYVAATLPVGWRIGKQGIAGRVEIDDNEDGTLIVSGYVEDGTYETWTGIPADAVRIVE